MVRRFFSENKIRFRWALIRLIYAAFGVATVVTGIAYLPITDGPESLPYGLALLTEWIPVELWGAAWAAAGVYGIVAAALDLRPPYLSWSAGALFALHGAWSAAYTAAWLLGKGTRSWLTAASYWDPTLLVLAVAIAATMLRPPIRNSE